MKEEKPTDSTEDKSKKLSEVIKLIDEDDLETKYNELKDKYILPNFEKICEDFDVEKVADKESSYLLREIRRIINEKVAAYLHLFETLINPTSPPIFVFSILRGMSNDDKEQMKNIYKALSKTQLAIMRLDTMYDEQSEAKFITDTFNLWQELKPQILEIIKGFEANFEKDDSSKKSSYFD
ncbi:hypothetical protein KAS08_03105 [Candidatus Pacearchaeota archaeon]|nr:hypothetical protein [Candidatus Pacearchaeota archaeon]